MAVLSKSVESGVWTRTENKKRETPLLVSKKEAICCTHAPDVCVSVGFYVCRSQLEV